MSLKIVSGFYSDRVAYFGCFVKTQRVSSKPASTDVLRNRSGNILAQRIRKPEYHCISFPEWSLSRSGVLCSSGQDFNLTQTGRRPLTLSKRFRDAKCFRLAPAQILRSLQKFIAIFHVNICKMCYTFLKCSSTFFRRMLETLSNSLLVWISTNSEKQQNYSIWMFQKNL